MTLPLRNDFRGNFFAADGEADRVTRHHIAVAGLVVGSFVFLRNPRTAVLLEQALLDSRWRGNDINRLRRISSLNLSRAQWPPGDQ
jgi:hypothetical protein